MTDEVVFEKSPTKRGPRTLCAEAVLRAMCESAAEFELPEGACKDMGLARKIADAVIEVVLDHIVVRMNFPKPR